MLAFIHVAKTGGKTVNMLLRSSFGAAYARALPWTGITPNDQTKEFVVPKYGIDEFRRLRRLCPFMRCVGGHAITLWSGLHEIQPTRYFAMMREPLRRGASHYQFHARTDRAPLSWEQWVNWPVHQNHQVRMFARDGNPEAAIRAIERHEVFVGLTERYDESLLILERVVAPELNIAYRRLNTASDNTITDQLLEDPARRESLRGMYSQEIPLYEYVVNDLFPRFQREYGPNLARDVEEFRRRRRDRVNGWNLRWHALYERLVLAPVVHRHQRRDVAS